MQITTKPLTQSSVTVEYIVEQSELSTYRASALAKLAAETTIKGFRKGKAPIDLVEANLDPDKIKHSLLHDLLNQLVQDTLKKDKFEIIGNPELVNLSNNDGKPWTLTITYPLKPKIDLSKLDDILKSIKSEKDFDKLSRDQKADKVLSGLSSKLTFDIPQALIDKEVEHSLAKLIRQTETLGLTVEKYLTSINKTAEELRSNYNQSARESLATELILLEIAKAKNIDATPTEVDDLIKSVPDPKSREQLAQPGERPYLESIIIKRKTIDYLLAT